MASKEELELKLEQHYKKNHHIFIISMIFVILMTMVTFEIEIIQDVIIIIIVILFGLTLLRFSNNLLEMRNAKIFATIKKHQDASFKKYQEDKIRHIIQNLYDNNDSNYYEVRAQQLEKLANHFDMKLK